MTKEELLPQVIEYFEGDKLAAEVWLDKYAMKDKKGEIIEKTPDDMHRRLAKEFFRIEDRYDNPIGEEVIYNLLKGFKYIVPQGSPMAGVGNNNVITSLSNCFVIGSNDNADSYSSIMRTDEEQIQLMKRRGGVGHDLSHLRPNGSFANNSILSGLAGTVAYAERYSNSTKEVSQGGRRGALMLTIDCRHPDTELFIDSKLESGKITGANISVKITDEFIECVKRDDDFYQSFPIDLKIPLGGDNDEIVSKLIYDKLTPIAGGYIKKVKAKRIWDKIIKNAHSSAEPGILFWDRVLKESPADLYGSDWKSISCNPCGELPLPEYDSCRLLLLNLFSYVDNPFTANAKFNFELFNGHVSIAQRLMDDLVDLEIEKIDKIIDKIKSDPEDDQLKFVELNLWDNIRKKAVDGRRTGLGITAEGDMLAALGLTYGSPESIKISEEVHKNLAVNSYKSSIIMAKERGCFPIWDSKLDESHPFLDRIYEELDEDTKLMWGMYGRRNIANLTIAPAGSVSIETQTTSGIEPVFMIYYNRRRRTEDKTKADFIDDHGEMFEEYKVFHHNFIKWFEINYWNNNYCGDFNIESAKEWLEKCSDEIVDSYIKESPYYLSTSADIDWVSKVELQGTVQRWVDHSISATTNIPENTPVSVVNDIYLKAHESGCKGMTIYREGSRSGILVSNKKEEFEYIDAVKRPKELECDIYRKTALKRDWMVVVGKLADKPYEIFAFPDVENQIFPSRISRGKVIKVKSGVYKLQSTEGDKVYELPNIIKYINIADQVDTRKYSIMLRHRIDPQWIIDSIEAYAIITSFDKVVQRVLKNYVKEQVESCPICGGEMRHEGGCPTCVDCGYSKCN